MKFVVAPWKIGISLLHILLYPTVSYGGLYICLFCSCYNPLIRFSTLQLIKSQYFSKLNPCGDKKYVHGTKSYKQEIIWGDSN